MRDVDKTRGQRRALALTAATVGVLAPLAFTAAAGAATDTWSGSSSAYWSDPGNWSPQAPQSGDALVFAGSNNLVNTNNTSVGSLYNGITFASNAGAFNISGNAINLGGDIVSNAANTETINDALTLTTNVTLNAANNLGTTPGIVLTGQLTGSGGITVNGPGLVVLQDSQALYQVYNTFTGGAVINGGTLESLATTRGYATIPYNPFGNGAVTLTNGGVALVGGGSSPLFTNAASFVTGTGGGSLVFAGGYGIFDGTAFSGSGPLAFTSAVACVTTLSSVGAVTSGTSTTFSGFSGTFSVSDSGTALFNLRLDSGFTAYSSFVNAALNLGNNSELTFGNTTDREMDIGTLSGVAGTSIGIGSGSSSIITLQIGSRNENSTFAGAIQYQVGLTKVGTGTFTLSTGTDSYSGPTAVNAGTLRVNTALTGGGPVTVAAGATLGGSGSIANGLNAIDVSGMLVAGPDSATIGKFTTGPQTWEGATDGSNGFLAKTSGTAVDELVMSGLTVPSSGTFVIDVTPLNGVAASLAPGVYVLVNDTESASSNPFASAATLSTLSLNVSAGVTVTGGGTFSLSERPDPTASNGYDLLLNAVAVAAPEPTSLLLFGVAAAPLTLRRRHVRRGQDLSGKTMRGA